MPHDDALATTAKRALYRMQKRRAKMESWWDDNFPKSTQYMHFIYESSLLCMEGCVALFSIWATQHQHTASVSAIIITSMVPIINKICAKLTAQRQRHSVIAHRTLHMPWLEMQFAIYLCLFLSWLNLETLSSLWHIAERRGGWQCSDSFQFLSCQKLKSFEPYTCICHSPRYFIITDGNPCSCMK